MRDFFELVISLMKFPFLLWYKMLSLACAFRGVLKLLFYIKMMRIVVILFEKTDYSLNFATA